MTDQMCQKQFVKFQAGNYLLHIRRPPEVDSDQVKIVIENNEWCTMWEIASILKISRSSIEDNLHQLGYINCFDVWVPHGFPLWLNGKESCQCRRHGFHPWVEKIPGEGNGNPLQYSCLENSMDRGAWWATAHGITKSRTLTLFTWVFTWVPHNAAATAKSLQLCPTLYDPIPGILQARTLEWVAISFSMGST